MSSPSRTAQFTRLHKTLKKYYKPVVPDGNRSVLEHLLFACCLEDAHYDVAEESYAALVHNFFDWNEVRVSTVRELSEVMVRLPEPAAAATRLKRVLQSVFEANYTFDLEELRKLNLGPAIERLGKCKGTTPFSVAYVAQAGLAGHAIAVDCGTLAALRLVDLISDDDVHKSVVPGLERAIPKPKGFEFASLLHQLGADFAANPYAPALHEILLDLNPDIRDRLRKRRVAKQPTEVTPPGEQKAAAKKDEPKPKRAASGKKRADVPASEEGTGREARIEAKPQEGKAVEQKSAVAGPATGKTPEPKPAERKKSAEDEPDTAERKKPAPIRGQEAATGKKKSPTGKKPLPAKDSPAKRKTATEDVTNQADAGRKDAGPTEPGASGLAKRKPR